MGGPKKLVLAFAVLAVSLAVALPAKAERTWLDWFNSAMFSFNKGVSGAFDGAAGYLPPVPADVGRGVENFATTWVGEPLNAGAYLLAGKPGEAGFSLNRMGVNVTRGWLGVVDRAAEEGMATRPTDYGLALCAQGVPAGPFIVVPLTGIRTVRDFAADWVAAHAILYGVLFGVLQMPISLQTLAAVEVVEEVVTLSIAGELGEVPADAKSDRLEVAQERYLAGRERLCTELAQR